MLVNTKGGYVQWSPKIVYITSNYDVDEWYQIDVTALERRITVVQKFGTEVTGNTEAVTTEVNFAGAQGPPSIRAATSLPLLATPYEGPSGALPHIMNLTKKRSLSLTDISKLEPECASNTYSLSYSRSRIGINNTDFETIMRYSRIGSI